ncbi:hypothetical protein U1769_06330 [Sphingomonas sp. ZT3P38]|uniref:hypothetical protein n=1 Tax=Parasphingomonas zepuensis TaxID=3096161 RepID=UPI002FCC25B5
MKKISADIVRREGGPTDLPALTEAQKAELAALPRKSESRPPSLDAGTLVPPQ